VTLPPAAVHFRTSRTSPPPSRMNFLENDFSKKWEIFKKMRLLFLLLALPAGAVAGGASSRSRASLPCDCRHRDPKAVSYFFLDARWCMRTVRSSGGMPYPPQYHPSSGLAESLACYCVAPRRCTFRRPLPSLLHLSADHLLQGTSSSAPPCHMIMMAQCLRGLSGVQCANAAGRNGCGR